jgi:hypothetical protein
MIRHVVFTCPQTGEKADALVPGLPDEEDSDPYRSVKCPACGWYYAVHWRTGTVLGEPGQEGKDEAT